MTTRIYGYRNVAYHSGPSPHGYAVFFATPEARDAALARLREQAIDEGLSRSAAHAGIYTCMRYVRADRDADMLDEIASEGSLRVS